MPMKTKIRSYTIAVAITLIFVLIVVFRFAFQEPDSPTALHPGPFNGIDDVQYFPANPDNAFANETAQLKAARQLKSVQTGRVNVRDLGRNTKLIGILDEPLGTELKVRGKWHFPSKPEKDSSVRMSIVSVNDRELDTPVVYFLGQLNITEDGKHRLPLADMQLAGQEWSMIAYETGELWVHTDLYPEEQIPDDPNTVLTFTTTASWQRYFTPMLVARRID